jgi:hypothetical protein
MQTRADKEREDLKKKFSAMIKKLKPKKRKK